MIRPPAASVFRHLALVASCRRPGRRRTRIPGSPPWTPRSCGRTARWPTLAPWEAPLASQPPSTTEAKLPANPTWPKITAHPFLRNRGRLTDLGTLGGTFGTATWMNNAGEVVGGATTRAEEAFHAFFWRKARWQTSELSMVTHPAWLTSRTPVARASVRRETARAVR
jgi:hypothetical protein